uniref:uncharacterized protein LOC104266331 n=1 Tax=Ciona intestinalis TaxID=7719 RepID=UPI000EF48D32|nr:uncharacterized protein LOC104266331 [Ciona intestinalis]|eukprot:XP_026695689.1 uncharacterized protein LOC104266331 [Ciona intestinalis]
MYGSIALVTCIICVLFSNSGLTSRDIFLHRRRQTSSNNLLGTPPHGRVRPCRKNRECFYGAECDERGRCVCKHQCNRQSNFPVCGNNRKTYKNACDLRRAACMRQRNIVRACFGDCSCLKSFRVRTKRLQTGVEGGQVTLFCYYPRPSYNFAIYKKRVHWYKVLGRGQKERVLKEEWIIKESFAHYKGRTSVSPINGNASLTISNLTLSDRGKYECQVRVGVQKNKDYVILLVQPNRRRPGSGIHPTPSTRLTKPHAKFQVTTREVQTAVRGKQVVLFCSFPVKRSKIRVFTQQVNWYKQERGNLVPVYRSDWITTRAHGSYR